MNIDTRIKFRHLTCFLEIARQRSFAKAADALAVSQPAVSKTLKELEDILDASLFERGKGGVSLTEAGLAFMRYAGPCVQALRDGVASLRGGEHDDRSHALRGSQGQGAPRPSTSGIGRGASWAAFPRGAWERSGDP